MKIKLEPNGTKPTRADQGAAGYDLYAADNYMIYPNEVVKVSCGVSMEIPEGVVGLQVRVALDAHVVQVYWWPTRYFDPDAPAAPTRHC